MDKINKLIRKNVLDIEPYIPGKPIKEVIRELGIEDISKLASNENPLGASPKALEAVGSNINNIHLYPDGSCFELKNKLAEKTGLSEDYFVFGNGSNDIITLIAKAFLHGDDEVIIAEQSFIIYSIMAKLMNVKAVFVPLKDYTHDLEAMYNKITSNTKLIVICNPNNPTGTMVAKKEFNDFMDKLPEDIIVVMDEAYYEYIDVDNFPESLSYVRQNRNIIVLRTFSKIYGLAGLRIGYGIATPEIIINLNKVRQPFNVNYLAQIAALAALEDEEFVEKSKKLNIDGMRYLEKEFNKLGLFYVESVGNFILVRVEKESNEIFQKLMKLGVIIRPMHGYNLPEFIRVTIGLKKENEKFIKALKQVLGKD
jgi:histidinol-phosphate aminotransferase